MHTFEEVLFDLRSKSSVDSFIVMTDAELGGLTTASLRHSTEEGGPSAESGCIVFEGNFSSEVPKTAPDNVRRLGQAAFSSKIRDGYYLWLGSYERQVASTLNVAIKGDGRVYGIFLKTDSYLEGDGVTEIWQTYLRTKRDEWEHLSVPILDLQLSSDGYLVAKRQQPSLQRVMALGFSLPGGGAMQADGPFKLCVASIEAGYNEDDLLAGWEE